MRLNTSLNAIKQNNQEKIIRLNFLKQRILNNFTAKFCKRLR